MAPGLSEKEFEFKWRHVFDCILVWPVTDLNNVDNILVLAQLENILLVRQLIITIGLLFGHQFDGDWGC